jgi:hypothetical protein
LVQGNIESIVKNGFVNSLTGPVLRGDISTIEKHLSVLEKKDEALYKSLSLNLLNLVAKKEDNTRLSKNEGKAHISNLNKKESSVEDIEIENSIENLLRNSNKHKEIYKLLGGLE